jgi:hypothetical protein
MKNNGHQIGRTELENLLLDQIREDLRSQWPYSAAAVLYAALAARKQNRTDPDSIRKMVASWPDPSKGWFLQKRLLPSDNEYKIGETESRKRLALASHIAASFSPKEVKGLLAYPQRLWQIVPARDMGLKDLPLPEATTREGCSPYEQGEDIVELGKRLLRIESTGRLLNFDCGLGSFLVDVAQKYSGVSLDGLECKDEIRVMFSIRQETLHHLSDRFRLYGRENAADLLGNGREKYDWIFADGTRSLEGLKVEALFPEMQEELLLEKEEILDPGMKTLYLARKMLKENGTAVVVIDRKKLSSGSRGELLVRRRLVEQGCLRAVIALAGDKLLVVMDPGQHDEVRMIDASEFETESDDQGNKILSVAGRDRVLAALEEKNPSARSVAREELASHHYSLDIQEYFSSIYEVKEGEELHRLQDVAKVIRGVSIRSEVLEKLVSQQPTDCIYLKLSNITNGLLHLDHDVVYLKEMQDSLKRYELRQDDIIMARGQFPFRLALVDFGTNRIGVPAGTHVICSGNAFIIRPDPSRADSRYIKAFLESQKAGAEIAQMMWGQQLPFLMKQSIESVHVVLPSLEKQKRLGREYSLQEQKTQSSFAEFQLNVENMQGMYDNHFVPDAKINLEQPKSYEEITSSRLLSYLYEQTKDGGVLKVPDCFFDDAVQQKVRESLSSPVPVRYVRMNWEKEDCEGVLALVDDMTSWMNQNSWMVKYLSFDEPGDVPEKISNPLAYAVWYTWVRVFYDDYYNDDFRLLETDIFNDPVPAGMEETFDWWHQDAEERLGEGPFAYDAVKHARRYMMLSGEMAPPRFLRYEKCMLAMALAMHLYGKEADHEH